MRALKIFYQLLGLYFIVVLCIKCMSLTGYQTGRTAGAGNWELTGSVNLTRSLLIYPYDDNGHGIELAERKEYFVVESEVKYGISERIDLGLRANIYTLGLNCKVQVLGDQESKFATALGLEGGRFYGEYYLQIPLYTSFHPAKNFLCYFSPKYIRLYAEDFDLHENYDYLNYTGFNGGVWFGYRDGVQVGLDYGLYRLRGVYYSAGVGPADDAHWSQTLGVGIRGNF
jgi:hypothetical protein